MATHNKRLQIVPITFAEAKAFILKHHRHHIPPQGHKFSIAVAIEEKIVGVATVGRPVSRHLDDGWTLEVTRCCTDGAPNACSKLYSTCWRIAQLMGYRKLITYILGIEPGTSLKAAGWTCIGKAGGDPWNRQNRPRSDKHPLQEKLRYEITDNNVTPATS